MSKKKKKTAKKNSKMAYMEKKAAIANIVANKHQVKTDVSTTTEEAKVSDSVKKNIPQKTAISSQYKEITVKNAEGDPDTTATILVQNQIDYIPKVSVIMPVYNVESYLRQCLDSVVNQTLREIEIICVDDDSTDKSLDILKEYAEKDKRIVIVTQKNSGSGKARNFGIDTAKGEFIAFMDSDDMYPSEKTLEHLYTAAVKNNVLICGGSLNQIKEGVLITDPKQFEPDYTFKKDGFMEYKDYQFDYGYWRFIYSRRFLQDNKLEFPDYLRQQDPPFFVKTMVIAKDFYALKEPTYVYRVSHKEIQWTERKVLDLYKARKDLLNIAIQNKLDSLYEKGVKYLSSPWLNSRIQDIVQSSPKVKKSALQTLLNINIKKILDYKILRNYYKIVADLLDSDNGRIFENKISVVIAVYNVQQYLPQCLDSVINQTLSDIQIICVNDGSTDDSLDILNGYHKKDARIEIINQKNQGLSCARNSALKYINGKYVVFLDSDDYIRLDTLQKIYDNMETKQLDMLSYSGVNFDDDTHEISDNEYWNFNWAPDTFNCTKFRLDDCISFLPKMAVTSCLTAYRSDLIQLLHIRFPAHLCFEDNVFFLKSISFARYLGINKNKFYYRRIHKASIMQNFNKHFSDYLKISDICISYAQNVSNNIFEAYKKSYLNSCHYRYNQLNKVDKRKYYKQTIRLLSKYNYTGSKIFKPSRFFLSLLKLPYYLWNIKKKSEELYVKKILLLLQLARIDIKNFGLKSNAVDIKAKHSFIKEPKFANDEQGVGKVALMHSSSDTLKIKVINSGILRILFRGQEKKIDGKRYPVWIDYESIKVNGKEILAEPVMTWHDKPYNYSMFVEDGQEITLEVKQQRHTYTLDELKDIVLKLNADDQRIRKNVSKVIKKLIKIMPVVTSKKHQVNTSKEQTSLPLSPLTTYRVDIKNFGGKDNTIIAVSDHSVITQPKFASDEQGIGKLIQGNALRDTIKLKVIKDGTLKIYFRGRDSRFDGKRIPIWINYKSIKIDGKEILAEPIATWHDEPFRYEMSVKDGQEIILEFEQTYYQYSEDELKDLLSKLKIDGITQNSILTIYRDNISFKDIPYTWRVLKDSLTQDANKIYFKDITKKTSGRLQIAIANTKFETMLIPSKNRKLYVFLSSGGKGVPYPTFHRISTFESYDGIRMFFDDPTRNELNENNISWYLGGQGKYFDYLAQIITKVSQCHDIKLKNITLIGSSNAGFACIQLATKLKGIQCIAMNPQLSIKVYLGKMINDLAQKVHINFDDPKYKDIVCTDHFIQNNQSKFFLFFNQKSSLDMPQIIHLQTLLGKKLPIGLNKITDNCLCGIVNIDAPNPHNVVPQENFIQIICKLLDGSVTPELESTYNLFVGELKKYWEQIKKIDCLNKELEKEQQK